MAKNLIENGIPRATFAKLAPEAHLLSTLAPGDPSAPSLRANGRAPAQARPPGVTFGSLNITQGSAVVRVGDSTAICGVRAETLLAANVPSYRRRRRLEERASGRVDDIEPTPEEEAQERERDAAELREYDLLVPNVELGMGACPMFMPGAPPSQLAQTISTRVYSLLHSSGLVSMDDLRIWREVEEEQENAAHDEEEDKMDEDGQGTEDPKHTPHMAKRKEVVAFFVLYIDIYFISYDGNGFDVSWAALVAALRDTRLPVAAWDADVEKIICSRTAPKRRLAIRGLPVAISAAVFRGDPAREDRDELDEPSWLLVDPDMEEEKLCAETATVVVDCTGGETRLLAVEKAGGLALDEQALEGLVGVAEGRWKEWDAVMVDGGGGKTL
jgi:exosome complex component RRP43